MKKEKYKNKYYVYIYIDPRTSQVFYVGKGTGGRAWVLSGRSKEHLQWINEIKSLNLLHIVKIAHVFDNEKDSLEREKILISYLLRAGHPLLNKNKGGGGHPGGILHPKFGKKTSDETKKKLSDALTGKPRPDVSALNKERMKGNTLKKGTKSSEYTKATISESLKGNQRSAVKILCENNGKIYNSVKEAWTELKLDERSVFRVLKGEFKYTKGYKFIYV
jgi:NUMOD3 motif